MGHSPRYNLRKENKRIIKSTILDEGVVTLLFQVQFLWLWHGHTPQYRREGSVLYQLAPSLIRVLANLSGR